MLIKMFDKKIIFVSTVIAIMLITSISSTANQLKIQNVDDRENDVIKFYWEGVSEEYNQIRPNIDIKKIEYEKNGRSLNLSLIVKGEIENRGDFYDEDGYYNGTFYYLLVETNMNIYYFFYVNHVCESYTGSIINYSSGGSKIDIRFNLSDIDENILVVYAETYEFLGLSCGYFYCDHTHDDEFDDIPPTIDLVSPEKAFYAFGKYIFGNFENLNPIILGKIKIKVDAIDYESGIDKVDFYIDGERVKTDFDEPYEFEWKEQCSGPHNIKIIAYDNADNNNSKELTVFKIL